LTSQESLAALPASILTGLTLKSTISGNVPGEEIACTLLTSITQIRLATTKVKVSINETYLDITRLAGLNSIILI
jgi:hypothetical protein